MKKPGLKAIDPLFINKIRKGDEKAFEELFDQFGQKIYGLSIKMGNSHEDAEGIVQDVFLKIWQKRNSINPNLSLPAYLFKIAKSMIIRKKRRQLLELSYLRMKALQDARFGFQNDEDIVIFEDLKSHAEKLVESLPKGQRQVFLMKNKENLSLDQIAEALNVPKRRVENQISRANKTLKTKLLAKEWGIASLIWITNAYLFFY
ncbi:RNA polymerase sigma factor [Pleomorphovibrio marinus]|uniref:RNA polymerase sigma factor n=1 Tax=Pleomorphovibrio marinus TaxID=2164132 RepID=UPI001300485C|nr:sigma-70 family RNA polymerase sigma factor [Pleomorphovibrio marinus]